MKHATGYNVTWEAEHEVITKVRAPYRCSNHQVMLDMRWVVRACSMAKQAVAWSSASC